MVHFGISGLRFVPKENYFILYLIISCCTGRFRRNLTMMGYRSIIIINPNLVGGFNPSEKYARQLVKLGASSPRFGVKIKNI